MAETPTPEAVAARSVVILGYCSTHPGIPFIEDMADHTAFCPLCEYLGTRRILDEQAREIERLKEEHVKRLKAVVDGTREKEVKLLLNEVVRLRNWVNDLQSGLYINCVYCGFRYGPGESTPATLPEAGETLAGAALREHVEKCPDHPMSRLKSEIDQAVQIINLLLEDTRSVGPEEPRERRIPTQIQVGEIREARSFCARAAAQRGAG